MTHAAEVVTPCIYGPVKSWQLIVGRALVGNRCRVRCNDDRSVNPFTADPVEALHFAILV